MDGAIKLSDDVRDGSGDGNDETLVVDWEALNKTEAAYIAIVLHT